METLDNACGCGLCKKDNPGFMLQVFGRTSKKLVSERACVLS